VSGRGPLALVLSQIRALAQVERNGRLRLSAGIDNKEGQTCHGFIRENIADECRPNIYTDSLPGPTRASKTPIQKHESVEPLGWRIRARRRSHQQPLKARSGLFQAWVWSDRFHQVVPQALGFVTLTKFEFRYKQTGKNAYLFPRHRFQKLRPRPKQCHTKN